MAMQRIGQSHSANTAFSGLTLRDMSRILDLTPWKYWEVHVEHLLADIRSDSVIFTEILIFLDQFCEDIRIVPRGKYSATGRRWNRDSEC